MKYIISILLTGFIVSQPAAQEIQLNFPHFAGKTYDFVIFQGEKQETIIQDTIPADGKFTLKIPEEYAPYTGMSRWLITGTAEGGGLDMVIPGKNFSVECLEAQPAEENIIYRNNNEVNLLNALYKEEQEIFAKSDAMKMALQSFSRTDMNYKVFDKEYHDQQKAYREFQMKLKKNSTSYAARFLNIVNFTMGIGTEIVDTEEKKAKNIADYMVQELDWKTLYTSGHWADVIDGWVSIYTMVLKDNYAFARDFAKIEKKLKDPRLFKSFADITAHNLTRQGRDDLIGAISPIVISSNKINEYEGALLSYMTGAVGTKAPDLLLLEHIGNVEDHNHKDNVLESKDFASGDYNRTLLIFYESGCSPCENLLQQLPGNYENIKSKGVKVMAVSADTDENVFKDKAKDFPWENTFCDYQGKTGINFKNYGVAGTPTIFLIDKSGKIEARMSSLQEVLEKLK